MERLTERDEYGNAEIIALSDVMPELYAGLSFEETNALTEALNRLAAYEDTGLAPERVTELARAEKDGRLVVLPPPAKEGDPKPECFYNELHNPWAWCLGMGKSRDDDEPTERCKACWYCESVRQEAEAALGKEAER